MSIPASDWIGYRLVSRVLAVLKVLPRRSAAPLQTQLQQNPCPEAVLDADPTRKISRRQQKLADYEPRVRLSKPRTIRPTVRPEVATTMRHIFLRDIEDSRLKIDHLLPDGSDVAMAKEILRSLLVLGRREAINRMKFRAIGFVLHRVADRYQQRSGRPFDFAVFRQTIKQLSNEGIIVIKENPGRSEKISLSLRSVPSEAANSQAAQIVGLLNKLKQDALAGNLV